MIFLSKMSLIIDGIMDWPVSSASRASRAVIVSPAQLRARVRALLEASRKAQFG